MNDWTPGRLHDRFAAVDRRLHELEVDVRAFGPAVGQAAFAFAAVEELERELRAVRAELVGVERAAAAEVAAATSAALAAVAAADKTANDVIRSGRTENLKLIGIVVGSFTTIATALITLVATGRLGP